MENQTTPKKKIRYSMISPTIPEWQTDASAQTCTKCNEEFSIFRWKHHCRACGLIFCGDCASSRILLTNLGYGEPVRVCEKCLKEASNLYEEAASVDVGTKHLSMKSPSKDSELKEWLVLIGNPNEYEKLKGKLFKGIPSHLRAAIWPLLSESFQLSKKNEGVFKYFVDNIQKAQYEEQILCDVKRTYPEHPMFQENGGPGQLALNRVLAALSFTCPEVGYAQGLNFIAAVLLMHLDEENAYWVLVQLMKKYHLEKIFLPESELMEKTLKKFTLWLGKLLPVIYEHLLKEELTCEVYFLQWLRTLYSYSFPLEVVFRIWDVFLLEGIDFLIWVGLSFLDAMEEKILKSRGADLILLFQNPPITSFDALVEQLKQQS